jgi:hypothetical protein
MGILPPSLTITSKICIICTQNFIIHCLLSQQLWKKLHYLSPLSFGKNITTLFDWSSHGHVIGYGNIHRLFLFGRNCYLLFLIASRFIVQVYSTVYLLCYLKILLFPIIDHLISSFIDHLISSIINHKLAIYTEKSII